MTREAAITSSTAPPPCAADSTRHTSDVEGTSLARMSDPTSLATSGVSPASLIVDAVGRCLSVVGLDEFITRFTKIAALIGAGQLTAFAYDESKASCLISRNLLIEEDNPTLAAIYVDGWYHQDPLFGQVMALPDGTTSVQRLEDLLPAISDEYYEIFFGKAGWRTKISIMVAMRPLRMVLNLYFGGKGGDSLIKHLDPLALSLYALIGTTLASHFTRSKPLGFPIPLAVLSERERQVCIGMLEGKKAEIIAEEIGIGPTSVVTYRQRAYQKLGISSRGQLFSICRG